MWSGTPPVDLDAAEAAAELLRPWVSRSTHDMAETPRRMAQAYAELLTVAPFDFTTFANTEDYDELVLVQDIPVRSLCEHHMLPFVGVAQSATSPTTGSSASPSSPGWSTSSAAAPRPRNG